MAVGVVAQERRLARALFPLGLLFLTVGIATAVVLPFLSLFLSTAVRVGPVRVTVFLVVAPLAGVVVGTLLGRLSDRVNRRWMLVGASLAGLVSMGLTTFVRDYWFLLGLAATFTAVAGALFPQTFAYARVVLARGGSSRAAMRISSLRTVFSLAWVAGPPLAAVLLHAGGFSYLYGTAAVMYGLGALVALFWLDDVEAAPVATPDHRPVVAEPTVGRSTLWLTVTAFTLLQCPLTLTTQALPLYVSIDLRGDISDAGIILGLCALLEIPLMLGLGALTIRFRLRPLLLIGSCCGVAYFASGFAATGVWVLIAAQLLNAAFIAAVSGLGISYVQDMMPHRPGHATTLFTNTFPIGAMLAGPLFGLSQWFGYRFAFGMATVLCAAGLVILVSARRSGRPTG